MNGVLIINSHARYFSVIPYNLINFLNLFTTKIGLSF